MSEKKKVHSALAGLRWIEYNKTNCLNLSDSRNFRVVRQTN
ncbi:hypothetical protein CLOSTMETH_01414 [[Clostridium] methylpentosum DSM 5476]|uniref:Uncharacterized protein n=1 Tax=[Clostridium] methylpentosum DSM 5476 TaxID=537013 RepID=C0EC45_9FIRM|nr:hypothetical protein CLOSTMETH_01414 [[Clostridium] methylpentosum DSM 5476]